MANKREEIINYKKSGSRICKKREEYNLTLKNNSLKSWYFYKTFIEY